MSSQQVQQRGITANKWTSLNPVLMKNEIGVEEDTNRIKIGNGISRWVDLPYYIFKEVVYILDENDNEISQQHGSILIKNISRDTVFEDKMSSGENITMHLTNASNYSITFPNCYWVSIYGDVEPQLTNKDVIVFWKIYNELYGSYIGSADHAIV